MTEIYALSQKLPSRRRVSYVLKGMKISGQIPVAGDAAGLPVKDIPGEGLQGHSLGQATPLIPWTEPL